MYTFKEKDEFLTPDCIESRLNLNRSLNRSHWVFFYKVCTMYHLFFLLSFFHVNAIHFLVQSIIHVYILKKGDWARILGASICFAKKCENFVKKYWEDFAKTKCIYFAVKIKSKEKDIIYYYFIFSFRSFVLWKS